MRNMKWPKLKKFDKINKRSKQRKNGKRFKQKAENKQSKKIKDQQGVTVCGVRYEIWRNVAKSKGKKEKNSAHKKQRTWRRSVSGVEQRSSRFSAQMTS